MPSPSAKGAPPEPSNAEIVVYILAAMGGAERSVHSEDLAARCYTAAPARFSWRLAEYRDRGWPDKYIVKTALEDAKKPEFGRLVDGAYALDLSKDGWRLTTAGARWFLKNKERLETHLRVAGSEIPRKESERFVRRVQNSTLFRRFATTSQIQKQDFFDLADLLECSPDARPGVVADKFQRLRAMAELIRDPEILRLFEAAAATFPNLGPQQEATGVE